VASMLARATAKRLNFMLRKFSVKYPRSVCTWTYPGG
jgi:hypothetical protein